MILIITLLISSSIQLSEYGWERFSFPFINATCIRKLLAPEDMQYEANCSEPYFTWLPEGEYYTETERCLLNCLNPWDYSPTFAEMARLYPIDAMDNNIMGQMCCSRDPRSVLCERWDIFDRNCIVRKEGDCPGGMDMYMNDWCAVISAIP
jgi:hypothetical protein